LSIIRKCGGEFATFSSQWEARDCCNEPMTNNFTLTGKNIKIYFFKEGHQKNLKTFRDPYLGQDLSMQVN
jgi:hypothetical protein